MQSLPYPIPGPAGIFSGTQSGHESRVDVEKSLVDKSARQSRVKSSDTTSLKSFDMPGWHALLVAYDLRPYGPDLLSSSIALIKSNAFRGDFQRLRLAARVEKMHFVGTNASVTLADPTGTIVATVLAEVFDNRKCGVQEGAILMLEGVTAIMYPERKPAGFYINLDAALHMTIQSSNIVHVFSAADELEMERKELVIPYSEEALRLPNADQETLRKQRSVVIDASEPSLSVNPRPVSGNSERFRNDNRGGSGSNQQQNYDRRMQTPRRPSYTNQYRKNRVEQRGRETSRNAASYNNRRRGSYCRDSDATSRPQTNQNWNKRPAPHQSATVSRPTQRPRSTNNSQAYHRALENNKPTETLSDDQLDVLLGSVDIDAAIASATQPNPTISSEKENSEPESSTNEKHVSLSSDKNEIPSHNNNNNTSDTLTDDQLDNLLGSVDIDCLLNG